MLVTTIGVYGFTEDAFVRALENSGADVFVDTRRRRGVRGSTYAYANSKRLQQIVQGAGMRYVHRKDLAPSAETRLTLDRHAKDSGLRRRERGYLTDQFVNAYKQECLTDFSSHGFLQSLGEDVESIVLFCVEGSPRACHRSLLAEQLAEDCGAIVEHVLP